MPKDQATLAIDPATNPPAITIDRLQLNEICRLSGNATPIGDFHSIVTKNLVGGSIKHAGEIGSGHWISTDLNKLFLGQESLDGVALAHDFTGLSVEHLDPNLHARRRRLLDHAGR